jgi:hypothetical protein
MRSCDGQGPLVHCAAVYNHLHFLDKPIELADGLQSVAATGPFRPNSALTALAIDLALGAGAAAIKGPA